MSLGLLKYSQDIYLAIDLEHSLLHSRVINLPHEYVMLPHEFSFHL